MPQTNIVPQIGEFFKVNEFVEMIRNTPQEPYRSVFSLTPFLQSYGGHLEHGCEMASSHMKPKVLEAMKYSGEEGFFENLSHEELDSTLESIFTMFLPSLVMEDTVTAVHSPFAPDFKYSTKGMKEFIHDDNWEMKTDHIAHEDPYVFNIVKKGTHILNTLYDQNIDLMSNAIFLMRNVETKLERYYKMVPNNNNIKIVVNGERPELSQEDITHLLNNMHDADIWLNAFPPSVFSFEGFMIGNLIEVTESEVVKKLSSQITRTREEFKVSEYKNVIQHELRNFLSIQDIDFGFVGLFFTEFFKKARYSLTAKSNGKMISEILSGANSYYNAVYKSGDFVIIGDLQKESGSDKILKALVQHNYRSLILFPVYSSEGRISNIIEIGSPRANEFNGLTLLKLRPIIDILIEGNNLFLRDMDNRTNQFIQQQFTSIHPSVEWKFEEVAQQYQIESSLDDFEGTIKPIVFKDVYPIYGQADIVGSSSKRNFGIQSDLLDNLVKVQEVMAQWIEIKNVHVLKSYLSRANKLHTRINKNFVTSDESLVVDLLTREIHPFLHQLSLRFDELPKDIYLDYLNYIDKDLGIVYRERKKYERSMSKLSQAISDYIEQDDAELQEILPHYFEKYKTDGIEYNMYVGQSIVPNIEFGDYYLKEFKLRQLVQLCEVTKLVDRLSPTLDVPLLTAQLVFVYNHTLSIRFRMDEKQFDVDGAYNVRYEILKKRIDKAVIKGTKDRLTIAGKIAIVYLQESDRREYIEYINYLIDQDLIEKEYEVLDLEKLQGAEGLKALRLTVKKQAALEHQIKNIEELELQA